MTGLLSGVVEYKNILINWQLYLPASISFNCEGHLVISSRFFYINGQISTEENLIKFTSTHKAKQQGNYYELYHGPDLLAKFYLFTK